MRRLKTWQPLVSEWLRWNWPELLILALALGVRCFQLGSRELWFDEAFEYHTSHAPLSQLWERIGLALQPPLFNLVLHGWLWGGSSVIWMRLLSVGLSVGAVAGTQAWLRLATSRRVALLGSLAMALMPGQIRYAQEISEYALLACLLPWILFALTWAWMAESWRPWLAWALLASLAICTQYGALLVVVPSAGVSLLVGLWQRQWRPSRQLVVSGLLPLAVLVGVYQLLLKKQLATTSRTALPWQGLDAEGIRQLQNVPQALGFELNGYPFNVISVDMLGILLGCVGFILISRAMERQLHPGEQQMLLWSAGIWVAYALAVRTGSYAYGFTGQRYALVLTPCLVLLLGMSLDTLWRWHPTPGGLALLGLALVLISGWPQPALSAQLRGPSSWPENEFLHSVMGQWQTQRNRELTIVHLGAAPAFTYYASHDPALELSCIEAPFYPAAAGDRSCSNVWLAPYLRGNDKAVALSAFTGPLPDRWWLIVSHDPRHEAQQIISGLAPTYRVERTLVAPGAAAYQLIRTAP